MLHAILVMDVWLLWGTDHIRDLPHCWLGGCTCRSVRASNDPHHPVMLRCVCVCVWSYRFCASWKSVGRTSQATSLSGYGGAAGTFKQYFLGCKSMPTVSVHAVVSVLSVLAHTFPLTLEALLKLTPDVVVLLHAGTHAPYSTPGYE